MNFEIDREKLSQAVSIINRTIPIKPTAPVLNNLLIEASKGGVKITGTNLDTTMKKWLPAKVNESGEVTIPARGFGELLGTIKDESILVETGKEIIKVKTSTAEAKIPTISAAEYPTISPPSSKGREKINRESLTKAIKAASIAASQDESRLVLTGILFKPDGKETKVVATDGYRLALYKTKRIMPSQAIVSARDMLDFIRLTEDTDDEGVNINLSEEENLAQFSLDQTEFYTRLIAGQFPEYDQIIPGEFIATLKTKKNDFLEALKIAATFAKDLGNVVLLSINDKEKVISASSSLAGEGKARFDGKVSGQDIKIAFNNRYLADGVGSVEGDDIEIKFAGPVSPALIKSPDSDSFIYIVMPVRTQS